MRRPPLSYANVMSTMAFFMGLGGVSYAAAVLPANSVGSTQLKSSAVTNSKIADATITSQKLKADTFKALKGQTGDRGFTGLTGSQGVKGDTGSAGPIGPKGDMGLVGPQGVKGDTGSKGDPGIGRVYSVVVDWTNVGTSYQWVNGSGQWRGNHVVDVSPVRVAGQDDRASVTFEESIEGCFAQAYFVPSAPAGFQSIDASRWSAANSDLEMRGSTITWHPNGQEAHPVRLNVLCSS